MTPQAFETMLQTEGFGEIVSIDRDPGYTLGDHQHPFEACALITRGAITLVVDGISTCYAQGDIFRLPANTPHLESAAQGVGYLVGRKL